ncbi:MAG: hypothetical protein HC897_19520, partial [Thermoanaerobaculia bacterium]|nr:hypothetical protein [Thermoanaerobaculia bacterium]
DGGEQAIHSLLGAEPAMARDAVVLRWDGPEGARYDVFVQTTGLAMVSEAHELETTEYQVPAEALADLPAGTRLFWRVEAVLADGSRLSSSAFDFQLDE